MGRTLEVLRAWAGQIGHRRAICPGLKHDHEIFCWKVLLCYCFCALVKKACLILFSMTAFINFKIFMARTYKNFKKFIGWLIQNIRQMIYISSIYFQKYHFTSYCDKSAVNVGCYVHVRFSSPNLCVLRNFDHYKVDNF